MKIKVTEYSGELNKIGDFLNYDLIIDLGSPGFSERFEEEREQALQKHLEMKRRIKEGIDEFKGYRRAN